MKQKTKHVIGGFIAVAMVVAAPHYAFAESDDSVSQEKSEQSRHEERGRVAEKRAEIEKEIQSMKKDRSALLDEKRQKACERVVSKVNAIRVKRSEQGTKHLEVFNKISERVQAFVTEKELTVENYDTLVANIDEKKAAVEAAIAVNTETAFACDTASTESPLRLPRTTIEAVRDSLKEYRTAIKDLIVNVRSSAEKTESTDTQSQSTTETTGEEQ